MAIINFPVSPDINDEYTFNSKTWMWNGSGWVAVVSGGGSPLSVEEEGVLVSSGVTVLNFVGDDVTADETGTGIVTITISGISGSGTVGPQGPQGDTGPSGAQGIPGSGFSLSIEDEGILVYSGVTVLNFVGDGVIASDIGGITTVTISGFIGPSGSQGIPGSGATTFIDLTDTPDSYAGYSGQMIIVNDDEDGLEFIPIASGVSAHDQNASTIIIPSGMGTPTYDDLQDYLNNAQSSGRIKAGTGVLTAHAGPDGTLDISEMEGMIHTANTQGSPLIYFKKAAYSGLALTDNAVNFIIITYTAPGGVPTLTYSTSASRPADNTYNAFVIGRCWRSGNDVEVITTGQNIYDMYGRAQDRLLTKYGTMDHASGGNLSAHATPLRLSCTAGVWYFGNTRIDTPKVGHVGDKFYVWYKTGGGAWTESAQLTLFSEVFDGGTSKVYETYQNGTSLGTLSGSKYGVYWIFTCPEGDLYVVPGTADYANIGAAQAATVPASLPPYLVNWGILIGRVICQKTAAAFYSVESVWTTKFTLSAAVDHASLANLAYASSGHTGFQPMTWEIIIANQTAVINHGYIANKGTLLTLLLPATAAVGNIVRVSGMGAGGWIITQNASGVIHFGNKNTTVGVGGSLASVHIMDAIELICCVANNEWNVISSVGNITVV